MKQRILIVDFGSQVTKLIARRIRDFGVFSEIIPFELLKKKILKTNEVKGIILSGGPSSVDETNSPKIPKFIYDLKLPVLGICYGLQLLCRDLGGTVKFAKEREFGKTKILIKKKSILFNNFYRPQKNYQVWMSHSDNVIKVPKNFEILASSDNCEAAIIQNKKKIFLVFSFIQKSFIPIKDQNY